MLPKRFKIVLLYLIQRLNNIFAASNHIVASVDIYIKKIPDCFVARRSSSCQICTTTRFLKVEDEVEKLVLDAVNNSRDQMFRDRRKASTKTNPPEV